MTDKKTIRRVIVASSVGTLFEWYDFYLYGSLAVFFGELFFPKGNERAALLASLATFGAGFGVRPLGALVFGRIGDLVGRYGQVGRLGGDVHRPRNGRRDYALRGSPHAFLVFRTPERLCPRMAGQTQISEHDRPAA